MNGIENFLDWLYARTWLVTTLTMVLLFLPMIYVMSGEKRSKLKRFGVGALLFSPLVLLWAPMMAGAYGYADEPQQMCVCGDLLCFMDHYETGGEGPSEDVYRLYVVDAKTGEKKFRKYIGRYSGLDKSSGHLLLYHEDDNYSLYDPRQDKVIKNYDTSSLRSSFEDLRAGVENVDASPGESVIRVSGKNGKQYFLEAFSGKLQDTDFKKLADTSNAYPTDNNYIYSPGPRDKQVKLFSMGSVKGSDKLKQVLLGEVEEPVKGMQFLDGEFIYHFRKQRLVIIKSYETTDHLNFILTALSGNGERRWQITQKELDGADYALTNKYGSCTGFGNNFIFNSGFWYYSVDLESGKVNWKQKF